MRKAAKLAVASFDTALVVRALAFGVRPAPVESG